MPLFIEEEKNFTLFKHYYPMAESIHFPEMASDLSFFAKNFDELYECKFWLPHLKKLFADLYQKEMRLIFCAHGQSDKGFGAPLLHPYASQDCCMIYGKLFKEMLQELKISANCKETGNYRLSHYLKYQEFYDSIAKKEILSKFPNPQFTLLYAPTWKDADGATSFFQNISSLCETLPSSINLIVKVHPLLEQRDPAQYYHIAHIIEQMPNRLLLETFLPIYPLLACADAYLGDYSSVGYDFLYFQKPMFFLLNESLPKGKIHHCGLVLKSIDELFENLAENPYRDQQEALYRKAFCVSRREGGEQTKHLDRSSYL